MKYIKYTYVDVKTKKPVSQQPARTGPVHPEDVTPTFAIESTFNTGVPTFYGIAEDTFTPEEWMQELTEEQFYIRFRDELKKRASKKRKQVEHSGITLTDGSTIRTDIDSQNRVTSLVASVNNDPELVSVDFESTPGTWTAISAQEAVEIGKAVSRHVQKCFTWCRGVHEQIDAMVTLDDALVIVQEINKFGVEEPEEVTA